VSDESEPARFIVDYENLPTNFPTHRHSSEFWEALGRTVATFGFLEETLGKAIYAFGATRIVSRDEIEAAYKKWLPTLERALTDQLGGLIDSYGKAVRGNAEATLGNLDEVLEDLRKAAVIRNVLCHCSWRPPDEQGKSVPLFVNRKMEIFDSSIDVAWLLQTQRHVVELAGAIVNSVTHMGWQFPGSSGPGVPI
jgi:hypothetical protein